MAGYKMVGNAVPCRLAYHLAKAIKAQIEAHHKKPHQIELQLSTITKAA